MLGRDENTTSFESTDINETIEHIDKKAKYIADGEEKEKFDNENRVERDIHFHSIQHTKGYGRKYAQSSIWDSIGPESRKKKKN